MWRDRSRVAAMPDRAWNSRRSDSTPARCGSGCGSRSIRARRGTGGASRFALGGSVVLTPAPRSSEASRWQATPASLLFSFAYWTTSDPLFQIRSWRRPSIGKRVRNAGCGHRLIPEDLRAGAGPHPDGLTRGPSGRGLWPQMTTVGPARRAELLHIPARDRASAVATVEHQISNPIPLGPRLWLHADRSSGCGPGSRLAKSRFIPEPYPSGPPSGEPARSCTCRTGGPSLPYWLGPR